MSKNCLLTINKTTVDNDNLEYFDALQCKTDWTNIQSKQINFQSSNSILLGGVGVTIKILSNGSIYSGSTLIGQEYTLTSTGSYSIKPIDDTKETEFLIIGLSKITRLWSENRYTMSIRNPEKMKFIPNSDVLLSQTGGTTLCIYPAYYSEDNTPFDISFIGDMPITTPSNVTSLRYNMAGTGYKVMMDCSVLKKFHLTEMGDAYFLPIGDIAELAECNWATQLGFRDEKAYGNIASLGSMTLLTLLNMSGSTISGSIEELVAALYAADKKSASSATRIHMYFGNNTSITFNGTVRREAGYLAWDDGGSAPSNIRFENS